MTKYLVTGVTGRLGYPTIKALLEHVSAKDVSVLVRDPTKVAGLESQGVKIVTGDYFDIAALVRAFKGIDKLLVIGAPGLSNRAPQHENIISAIEQSRPGHVVYVSFYHKPGSSIKLPEVTEVEEKSETDLIRSGVPYTIIRNALYTQMFEILLGGDVKSDGVRAFGPNGRTTYADINDLGQANANILKENGHESKSYFLNSGESQGLRDIAALWSEIYDTPVPYIYGTRREFIEFLLGKDVPLRRAEYMAAFINAVVEGEFAETTDTLAAILGRKPKSMQETFRSTVYRT